MVTFYPCRAFLQITAVFELKAIGLFVFCRLLITFANSLDPDQDDLDFKPIDTLLVTPGRRQSETLLTIEKNRSKIARNSVFNCHLSPVGRQMVIKNSVSNDFYLRSSIVLTFSITAYPV